MAQQQDETVRVSTAAIMDQLHHRYGRQIAILVQENAELAAANDQLIGELGETTARLAAMMDANDVVAPFRDVPTD